jgi:plasmid replication initiation protein
MANDIEKTPPIEDSLGYKVVKDNTLLRKAQTDLTRNERKLINYLISLIKPDDEYFKEFYIKISEFAALIGTESTHIYREFREMADDLENKSFWYKFPNGEVGKIHWVMKPKYHEKKGYMKLRLDPDMRDYLIGLQNNFTEYELYNILALNTKYSITVYELLKSYQYKKEKDIDIEELKELLGATTSTYKNYKNFRIKVLEPTIDDINLNTDLDVSYKCLDSKKKIIKSLQGHKVCYLRFYIKLKEISETFEVYTRMKDRINAIKSDQVPHQISFDTDNETTALFDDTTNQQIN